jgi:hypothetical protein
VPTTAHRMSPLPCRTCTSPRLTTPCPPPPPGGTPPESPPPTPPHHLAAHHQTPRHAPLHPPCVAAALWHLHLPRSPQVTQCEVHQVKVHIHVTLIAVVHTAGHSTAQHKQQSACKDRSFQRSGPDTCKDIVCLAIIHIEGAQHSTAQH